MVEEADLPVRVAGGQLLLQPRDLRLVHVVAVEREETDAPLGRLERVVPLAVHVERLVEALVRVVVVPERGIELHAGVEQGLVRPFEFIGEIAWRLAAIQVVAEHQAEFEREPGACLGEPLRDPQLSASPGATVADDRETDRLLGSWQHDLLDAHRPGRRCS